MERSAEFLRGCLHAIDDLPGMPEHLRLEWINRRIEIYTAELAAAEARESFPIPDTLPEVPEAREAGEPTAAEVIASAEKALVGLRNEVSAGCHPDAPVEELKDGIHFEPVLAVDAAIAIIARWKAGRG